MKKLTAIFIYTLTAFSFTITSCKNDDIHTPELPMQERKDIVMSKVDKQITELNTKFAIYLFCKLYEMEKEKPNWIISPFNVSAVLSLIANGADGSTLAELQHVLGTKEIMMDEINSYYQKMDKELENLDYTSGLKFSRAAFLDNSVNVFDSYADLSHKMFNTDINRIDYSNPQALTQLNYMHNAVTNGLFPPLFDELPEDRMAIYTNMAQFDGKWKKKFNKSETKIEDFTCADGTKKPVLMMQKTEKMYYWEDETVQMIEMPYGNEAFNMTFLIPFPAEPEKLSLEELMFHLMMMVYNSESEKREALVDARIPQFKVIYELYLKDILKELGIIEIFDKEKANLSKYASNDMNISMLNQSAYINVEENGYDEKEDQHIPSGMERKEFIVNRPFIFMIKEKSTGMILFMGQVTDLDWREMAKENSLQGKSVSE